VAQHGRDDLLKHGVAGNELADARFEGLYRLSVKMKSDDAS